MPQFIETMWFEKGKYPLLDLHQKRVDRAFESYFPRESPHDLSQVLPRPEGDEKYKVRMVYNEQSFETTCQVHQPRSIKNVRLVYDDAISYGHKFHDRSSLEALYQHRGGANEIIIIKNGKVTDSFWANLAFWNGNKWVTPSDNLLDGVMRAHLLESGRIEKATIHDYEVPWFEKMSFINALNELGETELSCDEIIF